MNQRRNLALVIATTVTLLFAGNVLANPPTDGPPGQGECEHGNSGQPCKPDPQPDHGQDCLEHGPFEGGVNEDHCLGTPSPSPSTSPSPSPSTSPSPSPSTSPSPSPSATPSFSPTPPPTSNPTPPPSETPAPPREKPEPPVIIVVPTPAPTPAVIPAPTPQVTLPPTDTL